MKKHIILLSALLLIGGLMTTSAYAEEAKGSAVATAEESMYSR